MARTKDMTVGSPTRLILAFALPLILGGLFQQLYSLMDSLIIGRIDGVTALAAVSSAGWLDWLVLSVAMGLAQGFSIEIAQRFGAEDTEGLQAAVGQSLTVSAVVCLVMTFLAQVFLHPVLVLMDTPQETLEMTELYLRIVFSGFTLVMGYNLFSGFLRSVGDSRTPLIAMTAAALLNIGLDVLLVAAFHWGVTGVAVATVFSQGVSCLICLVAVIRVPVLRAGSLRPDMKKIRYLMSLGVPLALSNVIISVGGLVLQSVVNGMGFIFVAGYSATSKMQGLVELAGSSVGNAVSTFAGQNLGAGKLDRVKQGTRQTLIINLCFAVAVGVLLVAFGRSMLSLFVEDEPEVVDQVITFGYRFLCVMSLGLPGLYVLFVFRSSLTGMGDSLAPMLSGLVELVMRIGCALLLPRFFGEWGIYSAEIAAWNGAGLFLIFAYRYRIRKMQALEKARTSGTETAES